MHLRTWKVRREGGGICPTESSGKHGVVPVLIRMFTHPLPNANVVTPLRWPNPQKEPFRMLWGGQRRTVAFITQIPAPTLCAHRAPVIPKPPTLWCVCDVLSSPIHASILFFLSFSFSFSFSFTFSAHLRVWFTDV